MAAQAPLAQLVRDVTQATYKDLHETLDAAGDADPSGRRERVLDFVMRTRHRVARLLVAVQWWSDFSAFHHTATSTRDAAAERAAALAHGADGLWSAAQAARAASAIAPALTPAAHILSAQTVFRRLPRILETAINVNLEDREATALNTASPSETSQIVGTPLPLSKTSNTDAMDIGSSVAGTSLPSSEARVLAPSSVEEDAVLRLGTTTRNVVRSALPPGCTILSWRVPDQESAVRIGIEGVWSCDVVLTSLDLDTAVFSVLRLAMHVAADKDAPGPMRAVAFRRSGGQSTAKTTARVLFSRDIEQEVRQLATFRIHVASQRALTAAPKPGLEGSDGNALLSSVSGTTLSSMDTSPPSCHVGESQLRRARAMLFALMSVMSDEIAVVFVLDHVRTQASALQGHPSWRRHGLYADGISKTAAPGSAVTIRYWSDTDSPAFVKICAPEGTASLDKRNSSVVCVEHSPVLLGVDMPSLDASSINVEKLVLRAASQRARHLLAGVSAHVSETAPALQVGDILQAAERVYLQVSFALRVGLEISVMLKCGSWSLRTCGTVRLAEISSSSQVGWSGRNFKSVDAAKSAVSVAVLKALVACELGYVERGCHAIDLPFLNRHPPGVASLGEDPEPCVGVHESEPSFRPPFVAMECHDPLVFISLASFDAENASTLEEVTVGNTIDVEQRPESEIIPSISQKVEPANSPSTEVKESVAVLKEKVPASDDDAVDASNPIKSDISTSDSSSGSKAMSRPQVDFRVRSLKRRVLQDGLTFVQAKRPRSRASEEWASTEHGSLMSGVESLARNGCSARAMFSLGCVWAECALRVKRDRILQALLGRGMLVDVLGDNETYSDFPASSQRTFLSLVSDPLPVVAAELVLCSNGHWKVCLTLLNGVAHNSVIGQGSNISYDDRSQELSFQYGEVSETSVRCFCLDFLRVRAMSYLSNGLKHGKLSNWCITRPTPTETVLQMGEVSLVLGIPKDAYDVIMLPKTPARDSLAPLIAEVLNGCGNSAGEVLSALLERAIPIALAIDGSVPQDRSRCRVGFSMCMRARLVLGGQESATHVVDIDSSKSERGVLVVDYARVLAAAPQTETAKKANASRMKYKPIPQWEKLISHLASKNAGREMYAGSSVVVPMALLRKVILAVVKTVGVQRR